MRYAISDIHGCSNTFRKMVKDILQLKKEDELFLLGDYVDRGPDSKGVLDEIIRLKSQGYQLRCLRGNHEEMLIEGYNGHAEYMEMWLLNGGVQALESFGVQHVKDIPEDYIDFLNQLEYFIELDDYILVHAGLNFNNIDLFEDHRALLWLRKYEVNPIRTGGRIVVHGHTPIAIDVIREAVARAGENYRIDIDNGCVYKSSRGDAYGSLCALNLDDRTIHLLPNQDNLQ